jgi:hypothetical protein
MENYDLHLIVGKRSSGFEYYPLTVETVQGGKHKVKLHIPALWMENPDEPQPSGWDLGLYLQNALMDSNLWYLVDDLFTLAQSSYTQGSFLVEIRAPELYQLLWENIFDAPELAYLKENFTIVRYLSKPSTVVSSPIKLPLDVLVVADPTNNPLQNLTNEESLKYFSSTRATGLSIDNLRSMLSHLKYDIIHMTGRAESRRNYTSVLFPGLSDLEIVPKDLRSLLKRCGARLLILHGVDENYDALLNFAHNILHADGPTILVVHEALVPDSWTLNDIYFRIIHDESIDIWMLRSIPQEMQPVLLLASGGADVLRISSQAPRLYAQLESQLQHTKNMRDTLSIKKEKIELPGDAHKAEPLLENLHFIEDTIKSLEEEEKPEDLLDYEHESGGMEPLTKAEKLSTAIEKQLGEAEARTKRVVNSWFRYGERIIDRKERLDPNTSYTYEIQIGVASEKSNVRDAVVIPEPELARFYSEEGIPLRVELYSSDFQILQSSQILTLPPPPEESNPVMFDVITPRSNCVARMRICIYFEQNLVQSLLVQAVVGDSKLKTNIKGNIAEVDYSLSDSLTNVNRLPPRTLNIAMNDRGNGTHSFFIAGSGLKRQFDFGEGEINSVVKKARNMLQSICSVNDSRGEMQYRYNSDNKGNEKGFIKDVKRLAEVGSILYAEIITKQDRTFQDQLYQTLGQSEAIIQISSMKSAKYVFPWALVYDKPLVQGDYNVCPQFLADLKKGGPPGHLNSQSCIMYGCTHQADSSVICPSGFWGFKHIIEQPLSLETTKRTGGKEVPLQIEIKGLTTSMMMGVSLDLSDVEKHKQEIEMLGDVDIDLMQTKQQIGIGLQRKDLHLIYFYCHGGRKGHETWLGIGKHEKLVPRDLVVGWKVHWPIEHPFVFINGCHTVDVTPDDFVDFNKTLSWCEASGVMGTEITIPESLGRHFASGFLQRFLNGNNVGIAVRGQRLAMLENYNLLGLAYTPYSSAELKLVHT